MTKFKIRLYNQITGETTYDYVWAYTWAEAERKADNEFNGFIEVVNVVND